MSYAFVLSFALVFLSTLPALAQLQRPQTPQPPFPYITRDITLTSSDGAVRLAGTLTLPRTEHSVPAVVLVPGAGAVDRDDTIQGHKPFLVIADYLARHNIAALRLDSRGIGGSFGEYAQTTGVELAADLLAGIQFLRDQPEVDRAAIGVIGHSEGGTVSSIAAAGSPNVKFVVLLAAPGLPDVELFAVRIGDAGRRKGLSASEVQRIQERFRRARADISRGEIDSETKDAVVEVVRLMLPAELNLPPAALDAAVDRQILADRAPNRSFFLTHAPGESLARVRCPVLALNGTQDQNVPSGENLAAIRSALTRGGNPDITTVPIEGLNHFFQPAVSTTSLDVGQIEETISPRALEAFTDWIHAHSATDRH